MLPQQNIFCSGNMQIDDVSCFSGCLLLVYGTPASGKTLLTSRIISYGSSKLPGWNWLTVNFDHFYPPDTRATKEAVGEPFDLKRARHEIRSFLEILLAYNVIGIQAELVASLNANTRAEFYNFVHYLNSQKQLFDDTGRLLMSDQKVVFVLDDNMPLRSMRHEYYHVAKKFRLGFAQMCITCPTSVALARNALRPIPIPDSTILTMEQNLELPNPSKFHWERRHAVVQNDEDEQTSIIHGCECAMHMVGEAVQNPVLPVTQDNTILQECCRAANLKNHVHQADNILRKCISKFLQVAPPESQKSVLAKEANALRKKLLGEVRAGLVRSGSGKWESDSNDLEHLGKVITDAFQDAMDSKLDHRSS